MHRRRGMIIGVIAAMLGCAGAAARPSAGGTSQWPMFQATPQRTGLTAAALPRTGTLKIAWTYQPAAKGNGFLDWGPVVWNGVVFTPDGLNHIIALDALNGSVRWQQQLASNTFTVTIAAQANLLLATTAITTKPTPTLFALDLVTGAVLWDNMTKGQPAIGGAEGAPAVVGERVFINYLQYEGAGGICAYAVSDGTLLWRRPLPRTSSYTPVASDGERVVVGTEAGEILALSAATGDELWKYATGVRPLLSGPTIVGPQVLVVAGTAIMAFDVATGRTVWSQPLGGEGSASSPAVHGTAAYVGTRDGKLVAVDVRDGRQLWVTELGVGAIESSPAIDAASGQLVVGSSANTVCVVELSSGKLRRKLELAPHASGNWKNSPALANRHIYIGSVDKTFYAVRTEP